MILRWRAPDGADHSPVALEFYKDDEILSAITTGAYPKESDGRRGTCSRASTTPGTLTDAEKPAIVPYLRTLPPKGF